MAVFLVAALAFAGGCAADGEAQKETPKVAKGDCPTCDPAGPSAFEQAGMGLRFYAPGDGWQVAYQFKMRNDMSRDNVHADQLPDDPSEFSAIQEERQLSLSDVFLFGYAVEGVEKRVIDNVQRDVATIKVVQAAASRSDLFSQDRLDTREYSLLFELDDLLRPIRETFFNAEYPHGKTIEVDMVSSLSGLDGGSSLFPHNVPRVQVQHTESDAPAMTGDLEAVADELVPGWRAEKYMEFAFANGDRVWWAQGALWPFYVDGWQGCGLLVSQNLAAR